MSCYRLWPSLAVLFINQGPQVGKPVELLTFLQPPPPSLSPHSSPKAFPHLLHLERIPPPCCYSITQQRTHTYFNRAARSHPELLLSNQWSNLCARLPGYSGRETGDKTPIRNLSTGSQDAGRGEQQVSQLQSRCVEMEVKGIGWDKQGNRAQPYFTLLQK